MATTKGTQMTRLAAGTPPLPGFVDGTRRSFLESVTYASQATSDVIEVARLPKGAVIAGMRIMTGVTTGTATFSVGVAGDTAKYRAAAALTVVDSWEEIGGAATLHQALANEETVLVTVAANTLPASGTLLVQVDYAFD